VSPILVRPVREQLEHDRVIRLLHGKSRRRFDAAMNPGAERNAPVGSGASAAFPDLVLHSLERGRRLEAVVEVETVESVNHLEALAEWAHFAKLRAAFHLYVPATMVDVARRLCEDNQITVTEVWSYHGLGDDVRFTLVQRSKEPPPIAAAPPRKVAPKASSPAKRPAASKAKAAGAKRSAVKRAPARSATKRGASAPPRRKAATSKKPSRTQRKS
jgi:hypothetical protein